MNWVLIVPYYIRWHYSQALLDMEQNFRNFLKFIYNFFSIHLLLFSLFAPWERMNEGYAKGLDIEAFFGTLVTNTIMRIIGALVRTIVIIFGIIFLLLACICVVVATVTWLIMPAIIMFLFLFGFMQLVL
jgi:hypothetical protein